ncbi:hypothetical protein BXO88_11105 [Oribacterium sp. C9]|uniref:peroxide stress protein YaaA n=1 Tax=Oribacterium sp. C9 TaxID=1943579 RepID=UPI00098FE4E0|nr:peroxide stress protein YaaA [Oribacterium sp. C9]OON85630.1 hypothetical protein BXO88_11105 [Oribacterium sp. C9]
MKIIISPAKKMRDASDIMEARDLPEYLDKAEHIKEWIQKLSYEEKKNLWKCNDRIAEQNELRFKEMNLRENLTPALLSYDGIQYQYMAPAVFEDGQNDYVESHLRILSGFYGVLRPFDGVTPYRLEMQTRARVDDFKDLYDYWGESLYKAVIDESRLIINLASREYSKCIEKYLTPEDRFITCIFGEPENGKVVQKGVYAKMARGEMVRYMASVNAETGDDIKGFNWSGYKFSEELSGDNEYIFLKG